jgi:NAD(P)-dependent dehydrogenase (short-subunit alcohol dehydrogenase family)
MRIQNAQEEVTFNLIINDIILSNESTYLSTRTNMEASSAPNPHTSFGNDPYYSNNSFNLFAPVAVFYTALAHVALLLLKPFPFSVNIAPKLPPERFILPSRSHADVPASSNPAESKSKHVAIVTGSNTGIGYETATSLAEQGYTVILACRSKEKGVTAADAINHKILVRATIKTGKLEGKAEFLTPLDLSSLQSVRSFANNFRKKYSHLNILVNNAGINTTGKSIDGIDLCFQTNFVGHYLLTRLLINPLLKAKNLYQSGDDVEAGRVVNLSSVTHHFSGCNELRNKEEFTNRSKKHDYAWWKVTAIPDASNNTYKESKLAALVFTHALNERFGAQGLRAVAVNPGSVASDIWRHYPEHVRKLFKLIYIDQEQGAATSIAGAVAKLPQGTMYLQPYWQPFRSLATASRLKKHGAKQALQIFGLGRNYKVPLPFMEMLGPFIGYSVTQPRLPLDLNGSADGLWDACAELTEIDKN